jgi:hypothetical protein
MIIMNLKQNTIQLNCDLNELVKFFNSIGAKISVKDCEGDDSELLLTSKDYIQFEDMTFYNCVFRFSKKDKILTVAYSMSFLSNIITIDLNFLNKFVEIVKGDFYFSICSNESIIYVTYFGGVINYESVTIENFDTNSPILQSLAESKGLKKVKGKFKEKTLDDLKYEVLDGLRNFESDYSLLLAPKWFKELNLKTSESVSGSSEEHYIVFDFIEAASIDFDNEDKDIEADVAENWKAIINPNFIAKLPVQVVNRIAFEIDDTPNNLRVIVKGNMSAEDIAIKYSKLICSFFNEPDAYKLGQQDFQFAEIKSANNRNNILTNKARIENIGSELLKVYNAYDF